MPRIIAITNMKGGVGKTTTTLNLGASLAEAGRRVLCIDIDPQANCTTGLGLRPEELPRSVYDLLVQPRKFSVTRAEDAIVPTQWARLEILPSHINLAGAELEISSRLGREVLMRKALSGVIDRYDYVLIDTPPALSLLTVNALCLANEVFIVARPEPWSLDGIENLLDTVDAVRRELNPNLMVTGVIATMVDQRASLSRAVLSRIDADPRLNGLLFRTLIRRNIQLAEASGTRKPVLVHAPRSHGAQAYRSLAREVLALAGEAAGDDDVMQMTGSWADGLVDDGEFDDEMDGSSADGVAVAPSASVVALDPSLRELPEAA